MQKDFETWLQVMLKQQSSQMNAGYGNTNRTGATTNESFNQSSASGFNGNITDKKVSENLEAFYKARDAIYNNK